MVSSGTLDVVPSLRYGEGRMTPLAPQIDLGSEHSALLTDNVPEFSVVIPCLNEADTLEICVRKGLRAFATAGILGEVIVADNASSDGSQEIAARKGARV